MSRSRFSFPSSYSPYSSPTSSQAGGQYSSSSEDEDIPPIPPPIVDEDDRKTNSEDELRVRVWNSKLPACAWFVTANDIEGQEVMGEVPDGERRRIVDEIMARVKTCMPDFSFAIVALCFQRVFHYHAVVTTCNQYSRQAVEDRMARCFPAQSVCVTPLYDNVEYAVRYVIQEQSVVYRTRGFAADGVGLMGSYGNIWAREHTGDNTRGFSANDLENWCFCGFPLYAVDPSPGKAKRGMLGTRRLYRMLGSSPGLKRRYYNREVVVREVARGDGREPVPSAGRSLGTSSASAPLVFHSSTT